MYHNGFDIKLGNRTKDIRNKMYLDRETKIVIDVNKEIRIMKKRVMREIIKRVNGMW